MMTAKEELEMLAVDCEELAKVAHSDGDKGLQRALLSITYRIRHAAKRFEASALHDDR